MINSEQIQEIQLQYSILCAMALNYDAGHRWDRLDCEAVTKAADGISTLLADRFADKALIAELKPIAAHAQRGWQEAHEQEALVEQAMTRIDEQAKSIDFLKEQLAQLANFNPDWDKLEAATDSLREHMAELTEANKRIADTDDELCKLLPGVQYMDPPDGGSVTPLEKVLRMVADYRQQIAEQAKRISKLERALDLARNSNSVLAIRSELEARTVTVKLPHQTDFDDPLSAYEAIEKCREEIKSACAAAGITLVVGE